MAALITQAQWRLAVGARVVADLCAPDADEVSAGIIASSIADEMLAKASDWVQEFATAAGVTLTAGSLTAAMRHRVAVAASYMAATRKQEYREAGGKPPFHVEYAQAEQELAAWADRVRSLSTDAPSEAPEVLSDEARGW